MKKAKITFLMVAFNGEGFIRQSIESVLKQTERDIRLIIRNNASTDSTGKICKEYAKRDHRVTCLENAKSYVTDEGVTVYHRGFWPAIDSEYVSYIDHDDILDLEFAGKMYRAAKKTDADLAVCGCVFFADKKMAVIGNRDAPDLVTGNMADVSSCFCEIYNVFRTVWGKLYRTEMFDRYYEESYQVPQNLELSTDTFRVFTYAEHCRSFVSLNEKLYFYRVRSNSSYNSQRPKLKRIGEADALLEKGIRFLNLYQIATTDNIELLYQMHWGHMVSLIQLITDSGQMTDTEKLEYVQEILKNREVKVYADNSFFVMMESMRPILSKILTGAKDQSRFYSFYLCRLHVAYSQKHLQNNCLTFTLTLSAVLDKENVNGFGLTLLSGQRSSMSRGEYYFSSLSQTAQRQILGDREALRRELKWNCDEEKLETLRLELDAAVEEEDYDKAAERLGVLNTRYPEDEHAFYYRIYLSFLGGDAEFAFQQAYAAMALWPDSKELMELCRVVLDSCAM